MQTTSRVFSFIGVLLPGALASLLIFIPMGMGASIPAAAQEADAPAVSKTPVIPQQVRYAGKLATRAGETVEAEFRIYAVAQGGEPLWTETQRISVGEDGSYSVLLGSASTSGLPQTFFAGGAARWLGVSIERSAEQERVLLSSVPYAMKSADAESLAGHAASDFVTQNQLAQLAQLAQSSKQDAASPDTQPNTSGTVTGSGTNGTVPLWTGALTQGNSEITQVGSDIGINEATPGATLDVGGTENVEGTLTLPPVTPATASIGYRSQLLALSASGWSTTTNAPIDETFKLFVEPEYNNTANPDGILYFQFQQGSGTKTNFLSMTSNGIIAFAPGQTFPGTLNSVTSTSPVTATTTSGAVHLGLNTSSLETTLNSVYAGLAAGNNVFAGSATFAGPITAASSGPGGAVTGGSMTGPGIIGNSQSPAEGAAGILGYINTSPSASYSTVDAVGTAGVWGDANGNPGGADWGAGIVGTASSDTGYGGVFYNSTSIKPTVWGFNAASATDNSAITTGGGGGVIGTSTNASGVTGQAEAPVSGEAGVFGFTNKSTSSNYASVVGSSSLVAGVWGDTTGNPVADEGSAGVVGTASGTFGYGGYFLNSAVSLSAVHALNNTGPGLDSTGTGADGVIAYAVAGSGGAGTGRSGVYGLAFSPSPGNGGVVGTVYEASNTSSKVAAIGPGFVAGVWGDAGGTSGAELYKAGVVGTGDDITAGVFENNSPAGHPTLSATSLYAGTTGTLFKTFMAAAPDGLCGFGSGGDMNCTGRVKALVSVGGGERKVETYSVQSPENWMEDFGSGELQYGVAVVTIDPAFAETVTGDASYHVFITPNGDSEGLYVIKKTPTSFEVRESKGGTSSLSFDYRIVAKRRGYETQRLIDVTERFKVETAHVMPPAEAHALQNISRPGPMAMKPGVNRSAQIPTRDNPFAKNAAFQQRDKTKP
ncbi:MAG: hypothetical protein ABSG96_08535 [Terracidiphilus sp.]